MPAVQLGAGPVSAKLVIIFVKVFQIFQSSCINEALFDVAGCFYPRFRAILALTAFVCKERNEKHGNDHLS